MVVSPLRGKIYKLRNIEKSMELDMLKKIGLTDGEIKVYNSLIDLGPSQIFKIMKKSKVSSSKVYLILDKLMQKGLVSFITEGRKKTYQITNPSNVIALVEEKKQEYENFKKSFEKIIPTIKSKLSNYEEESAQIHKGIKGLASAYKSVLDELDAGEEYYFFTVNEEEINTPEVIDFFKKYHLQRAAKKVKVKGIMMPSIGPSNYQTKVLGKFSEIKYYNLTMPVGMIIGKNRVLILMFGENPICYEMISKRLTNHYKKFFLKLWKIAKS